MENIIDRLNALQKQLIDTSNEIERLKNESSKLQVTHDSWENAEKITHTDGFVYVRCSDLIFCK